MLDIYYDIDYKGFSKNITLPFLEKFLRYRDKYYPELYNVDKDLLEARLALMFPFSLTGITRFKYFRKGREKGKGNWEHCFFNENATEGDRWNGTDYGYYNKFVMLGFQNQEKSRDGYLLWLLFIKHPELFDNYIAKPNKINKDLYKENMIYRIDVMTGDNDINHYQLINTLLSEANHLSNSHHFNYNAVISKIEKIKKDIELSKKQLDLLPK